MRFVSMPTTLEWYMKHIFPFQRGLLKAVRPIANRVSPVELPTDSYFANIQDLFGKLDGIGELLEDPNVTSVRLVTNPGTHGAARNAARLRLLFAARADGGWHDRQPRAAAGQSPTPGSRSGARRRRKILEEIDAYFAPVPVKRVPLFTHEVLGRERLEELARALYAEKEDPAAVTRTEAPYTFAKRDGALRSAAAGCRSRSRARWGCSRRATNWWWRSARCAGTSACRPPWRPCRPPAPSWRIRY